MTKVLLMMLLAFQLILPVSAVEIVAPQVPLSGMEYMPEDTGSFGTALSELIQSAVKRMYPDLEEAAEICICLLAGSLIISVMSLISENKSNVLSLTAAVVISSVLLQPINSMFHLAAEVIEELQTYGKLLCPVMTTALAMQGGVTSSSALYLGTTVFTAILNSLISFCLFPMVTAYLAMAIGNCAFGEDGMRRFADAIKSVLSWLLKTLLMVFTTYMSITGVISGTTDAAALKAAKLTISTAVPVVGGILSDVSDSVLISMELMKNTAGVYGIIAVLAVCIGPFLHVSIHYLLLKMTAALCSVFSSKNVSTLINDFSAALGLLLAMIGSGCLLILISTVCFLKGVT